MAYDDGYYYGLAKIVALGTVAGDDGKTVTLTNGTKSWTGTMADLKCTFTVPGKDRYTIRMGTYSTDIDVSYGECVGVYMADGYDIVRQKDLDALEAELKANFQGGVDSCYNAVKSKGTTPASKSLSDVVKGIKAIKPVVQKVGSVGRPSNYRDMTKTFNCTGVPGWQNLTSGNFYFVPTSYMAKWITYDVKEEDIGGYPKAGSETGDGSLTWSVSYNASTGVCTVKTAWYRALRSDYTATEGCFGGDLYCVRAVVNGQ